MFIAHGPRKNYFWPRRSGTILAGLPCLPGLLMLLMLSAVSAAGEQRVEDEITPLPPNAVHFHGYLEDYIQNSIAHWNQEVVPYAGFVQMFRTGRKQFAQGEMWGKAVRSGSMFYRDTHDPELKHILQQTVADLLTTRRPNGSYSCSGASKQPDGPGGDLWERKYVLLGLDEYYRQVDKDPAAYCGR
jgi:hypothetical protein